MSGRRLFRRSDEIDEEIQAHLRMAVQERMARGESRADAEFAARREFGNVTHVAEVTREMRGLMWLEGILQDVRYTLRLGRRSPGFVLAAISTIAIGIGATTAIISVVDSILLRSLPVAHPRELVALDARSRQGDRLNFSYPFFERLRDGKQVFSSVIAAEDGFRQQDVVTAAGGSADEARVQLVSGEYFSVLGVRPRLGRFFATSDDHVAGHAVAVVSYAFWSGRLGGDTAVVGRQLRIKDQPFTVIGVAPQGFFGHEVGRAPQIWVPLTTQPKFDNGSSYLPDPRTGWLRVMGRLGAAAPTPRAAEAALSVVRAREAPPGVASRLLPISITDARRGLPELREALTMPLRVLTGIAFVVLLVACANVANLLLARAVARQREVAIRLSIGASRRRLVRQFLTEGMTLSLAGGVVGVLLAWWGSRALLALLSNDGAALSVDLTPDGRLLASAIALTVMTAVAFSLTPALVATRGEVSNVLRQVRSSGNAGRLSRGVIASEVALSLLVLTGAVLFLQTLRNMRAYDLGYSTTGLVQFRIQVQNEPASGALRAEVQDRIGALPGVRGVTLGRVGFGSGISTTCCIAVQGHDHAASEDREVQTAGVAAGYFKVMRLHLRGRDFESREMTPGPAPTARVAIINEEFARRFFQDSDPIGKRFGWGDARDVADDVEIVGVARNGVYDDLRANPRPLVYFPSSAGALFTMRADQSPEMVAAMVRRELTALAPHATLGEFSSIHALVERTLSRERMLATLLSGFAFVAVALAAIGLYGLMSYSVAARTREIGIRMALGSTRFTVLVDEIRRAVAIAAFGVGLGIPVTLGAGRLIRSQLFGVSATDPLTLGATSVLLLLIAAGAACVPARRAFHVDPLVALRAD
jgi:predicted permease